jgi:hypothetical protein
VHSQIVPFAMRQWRSFGAEAAARTAIHRVSSDGQDRDESMCGYFYHDRIT